MSKLTWDADGSHFYETGVNKGVLYVMGTTGYSNGVAWNGLTAVTESPTGAEANAVYADNIKYLNLYSTEEFGATIEAYTYPDEFAECDGSASPSGLSGMGFGQQARKTFGLCYSTKYGNDVAGDDYGYKIHIIYGCKASPSEKAYQTINDSPEAITFSWEVNTTPTSDVPSGMNPTSTLVFDSVKLGSAKMAALENLLYGIDAAAFDATKTYAVGDYCTYTESSTTKTYICNTAISTPAAWDATKWTEVTNASAHLPSPTELVTALSAISDDDDE